MFLIRDIMYCKPGKVRAMTDKFLAMSKLGAKVGMPPMRIMTDFCAERYWTVVSEMEVADLGSFEFDHELLAVMGDTGVARCWIRYLSSDGASVDQEYSDIWVARFAQDGRCREFIEWFMLRGPETE